MTVLHVSRGRFGGAFKVAPTRAPGVGPASAGVALPFSLSFPTPTAFLRGRSMRGDSNSAFVHLQLVVVGLGEDTYWSARKSSWRGGKGHLAGWFLPMRKGSVWSTGGRRLRPSLSPNLPLGSAQVGSA